MDVLRQANRAEAQGRQILHLEVGEPAGGAPMEAVEAAKAALDQGKNMGYLDALGLSALRERISRLYREWYGLEIDPGRIMITSGASGGFVLSFLAAFDEGQRVALADPGYPCYRNTLEALGIEPVRVRTELEDGFQPTLGQLEKLKGQIDGLILASPANPTGSLIERGKLKELTEHCVCQGIRLISDEIYHGLTYGDFASSVLAFTDDAIVVNSFSKFFRMTGWRIGWLVLPPGLVRHAERLGQNLYISSSAIGQHAALGAFAAEKRLRADLQTYSRNREHLIGALKAGGVDRIASADGAFYVYADVSHLTSDSISFCSKALADIGVAFTPGLDFDPDRGHHFVRFSFAADEATIQKASSLLRDWLKTI